MDFSVKMNRNNSLIISFIVLSLFILVIFLFNTQKQSFAQTSCPSNTIFTHNAATLVGQINDVGGDRNITAWFEWGETQSLGKSTSKQFLRVDNVPFRFCSSIANLTPCTTYYYRAVAQNSGGTSFGDILSFTTLCVNPRVDLKANGSDTNITILPGDSVNLTWSSNDVTSCSAVSSPFVSSWSGSKTLSGSQVISNLSAGRYTFTLNCTGFNQTVSDSVTVEVKANPPTVITLPAVQTL